MSNTLKITVLLVCCLTVPACKQQVDTSGIEEFEQWRQAQIEFVEKRQQQWVEDDKREQAAAAAWAVEEAAIDADLDVAIVVAKEVATEVGGYVTRCDYLKGTLTVAFSTGLDCLETATMEQQATRFGEQVLLRTTTVKQIVINWHHDDRNDIWGTSIYNEQGLTHDLTL